MVEAEEEATVEVKVTAVVSDSAWYANLFEEMYVPSKL